MGDKSRGLYNKFHVIRTDGQSSPIGKHYACDYFVLDLTHDKYAPPAILAYADACAEEYPLLARDLREKVAQGLGDGIACMKALKSAIKAHALDDEGDA